MAKWIPGQGFYLVQHSGPYDKAELKREMDELEIKLQQAEKRMEERK